MPNSQLHVRRLQHRLPAHALALVCLLGFGGTAAAQAAGSWLYDGITFAKTVWTDDGSSSEDPSDYFGYSAPIGTQSVVVFADSRAKSEVTTLSADMFAVGLKDSHFATASGRADSLYYGFTPGRYRVSFNYELTNPITGLITLDAEAGLEALGFKESFTSGSGTFAKELQLNGPIGFYAWADGSAIDGTAKSFAKLTNISVVAAPVPEPSTWLMFAGGLMLFGALRRRAQLSCARMVQSAD